MKTGLVDVSGEWIERYANRLRASVWDRLYDRVDVMVMDHVKDQLRGQVRGQVETRVYDLISRRV
jgi:hypothetical protein